MTHPSTDVYVLPGFRNNDPHPFADVLVRRHNVPTDVLFAVHPVDEPVHDKGLKRNELELRVVATVVKEAILAITPSCV